MVEFVSRYENFEGLVYSSLISGHGAIYGTTACGKSYLVKKLCLNGNFAHCGAIVFLGGKSGSLPETFVNDMKDHWNTLVYSYQVRTEEELLAKVNEIEDSIVRHRNSEYKRLGVKPVDDVDMRPNMAFANVKIIIDDLHKQVVKSVEISTKFAFIRHSGVELLFVTQSFKNINMHDLVKENLMWVVLFKLSQNKVTLNSFLSDLSLHSSKSRTKGQVYRSSLEYIYTKLVMMNDSILGFNPDDTSYLYIEMPKRAPKNVSHVRTAISNPNSQICFKEEGCNQVKILFAERKEKLTYATRMNASMRVMSEREQTQKVKNVSFDKSEMKDGSSTSSSEDEILENDVTQPLFSMKPNSEKSHSDKNRNRTSFLPSRGFSVDNSFSSDSDSTFIPSEEEAEIYTKSNPLKQKRERKLVMNKERKRNKRHHSHNINVHCGEEDSRERNANPKPGRKSFKNNDRGKSTNRFRPDIFGCAGGRRRKHSKQRSDRAIAETTNVKHRKSHRINFKNHRSSNSNGSTSTTANDNEGVQRSQNHH